MKATPAVPLRLLRAAIALVLGFAAVGTIWMVWTAVLNPDVQARQPGWFEGTFSIPFWVPLIMTFVAGCAAVIAVYAIAAGRMKNGEDLHAASFRDTRRRHLEEERDRLRAAE